MVVDDVLLGRVAEQHPLVARLVVRQLDLCGWCGVVWCGLVWCGVVWCGCLGVAWCVVVILVWCGVAWLSWCGVALRFHYNTISTTPHQPHKTRQHHTLPKSPSTPHTTTTSFYCTPIPLRPSHAPVLWSRHVAADRVSSR